MGESGCLRDAHFQNLDVESLEVDDIKSKMVTTTEIAGDLTTTNVNVTKSVIAPGVINYQVVLTLSNLDSSGTEHDIIGIEDAASTVVNLPTTFTLVSGNARCKTAEGTAQTINLVLSSVGSLKEDVVVTTGTFLTLVNNLDINSTSTNFTPFVSVPKSVAPSTLLYLYMTAGDTNPAETAMGAGIIVINLLGYTNNTSKPSAITLPTLNNWSRPIIKITGSVSLNASQSGSLFLVGPAADGLAADTVVTLPTAAVGLQFEFIYVGGAVDVHDLQINTGSDTNNFIGSVGIIDSNTPNAKKPIYGDNSSNSKANFLTPDAGTRLGCVCDGTDWFLFGVLFAKEGTPVTFAKQ